MSAVNSPTNQQPKNGTFKLQILSFFVILLLVIKLLTMAFTHPSQGHALDLTLDNILTSINKERSMRNLITLNSDSRLSYAAQNKSNDMIARHYFDHVNPEGQYIWPSIEAAGYTPYLQLGENLAIEFYSTESLVQAWMNSPTHRANILNEGFKDQGMGLAYGDSSAGQYHSAITNTFGALLVIKKKVPVPTPTPASTPQKVSSVPKPKPTPKITKLSPTPTPSPAQTPAPTPTEKFAIRGAEDSTSFALPEHATTSTTTETSEASSTIPSATPSAPPPGPIGNLSTQGGPKSDTMPYFIGILLLLIMVIDVRRVLQNRVEHPYKKINTWVVLILSILAVVFIYWM